MNKQQEKHFNELFKVKIIRKLEKLDKELEKTKITRNEKADIKRTIKQIKYGFEEGLKYGANKIRG